MLSTGAIATATRKRVDGNGPRGGGQRVTRGLPSGNLREHFTIVGIAAVAHIVQTG
jgi:hypothetical protein